MRKATIIKYEKEFIAWCKGESVLLGAPISMHDRNLIWREVKDFNDWKPLDTVYVLNDSYSDYRKALAEGKSIEFYELVDEDEFDSTKDVYKWLEWRSATPSSAFTKTLNYRIKPEEPKFKVGDWVVHPDVDIPWRITQNSINHLDNSELELWQPKSNEYFWYKKDLVKFDKTETNARVLLQSISGYSYYPSENFEDFCEPFIGKLPLYLKELNKNE